MKRFLLHFFLLTLILGGLMFSTLVLLPYSKKFGYQFVDSEDLSKARWVYCRLFENAAPIDVALLGTSHTYFGLNDTLISEIVSKETGKSFHIVNLAFPGRGRNHHLTLVEDLLATKQPKAIVLEVMEVESRSSHDISGAIATDRQIGSILHPLNLKLVRDLSTYFNARKRYLQYWLGAEEELIGCETSNVRTFILENSVLTLDQAKEKRDALLSMRKPILLPKSQRKLEFAFPLSVVRGIIERCKERGVDIYFLYNPYYTAPTRPMEYFSDFYESHGMLLTPPKEILDNHAFWFDGDHLNADGNRALSAWVASKLVQQLD
jgi:hypothetical protein